MAKGNFGERMKRERELREVSLAEVTRGTRISQQFLEALENEQWDKLPGGVFSRGFVRSIARYLGLNEEDFLSEFDLARGDQTMAAPAPYRNQLPAAPRWVPALAIVALVFLAVGIFYGGRNAWHRYAAYRAAHPSGNNTAGASSAGNVNAPPDKLELTVTTTVPSHVRIIADDLVQLDGDILPGDTHHFSAAQQFQINAADGAAVHLELNGRPITTRAALGNSSRTSDTIVLGYKDLRPEHDGTSRP
jgi:transcriptional regulator with XRE-family HTH domain